MHDSWIVAKASENQELKEVIAIDPYFYIRRSDILQLLKTSDDYMIKLMLKNQIMLGVT